MISLKIAWARGTVYYYSDFVFSNYDFNNIMIRYSPVTRTKAKSTGNRSMTSETVVRSITRPWQVPATVYDIISYGRVCARVEQNRRRLNGKR